MPEPTLKRYTELPYVLHALEKRRITLVRPTAWDDKNDTHHIEWYRKRKKLKTLLAVCLSEAEQTYHHWRVFTNGASGACIEFDRKGLISWVKLNPELRGSPVIYRTLSQVRSTTPLLDELPFLKREAYIDEKEYRLIYEDREKSVKLQEFEFPLDLIVRVKVNPWLPLPIARSIAAQVRRIPGCGELKLQRSTVVESDEWQRIGRNA